MSARHKARKRALDVLFEAEQRRLEPIGLLATRIQDGEPPVPEYAVTLVEGVVAHQVQIDEALATYAHGWTLDRMPSVDRGILRIATWELLHAEDVPDDVVISEAVTLASELSTDESPAFVNGLLARIRSLKATLQA
ncbi:transcription antitermination factor NusB [Aquipuribacter hungaricus]|uniref:transcription antitermination factor NusB n=1 Tax=Aquipuribacter hungaricus TaxID=545624 RepID=UPI0030EB8B32